MALLLKNREDAAEEPEGKRGRGRPKSKATPKSKGKPRAKATSKSKAQPKATPKSQPRRKATPKSQAKATPKSKPKAAKSEPAAEGQAEPKATAKSKATRQPKKRPAAAITADVQPNAVQDLPTAAQEASLPNDVPGGTPGKDSHAELPHTFARRAKPSTINGLEKYGKIVMAFRHEIQPLLMGSRMRTVAEA